MKKKLRIFWLCIFLLSIALGAQAAQVAWDVGPLGATGSYTIPLGGNAATFVYYPPYTVYDQSNNGNQSSSILSLPVSHTTTEPFGTFPGEIQMYAMGGGGTHVDGVVNRAAAQVTRTDYSGSQYVNAGNQHIDSLVARSFSADPGAEVTVNADITGMMDWINSNWNWSDGSPGSLTGPIDFGQPYSAYRISASVTFLPGSISGGSVSADIPDPIYLDQDNLSGSLSFISDSDPDVYYRLFASLSIDTRLQNFSFTAGPLGALPDVGSIGAQLDPLLMTTTVEQAPVPLPGSIILLFSGLAGLATLRRRRK